MMTMMMFSCIFKLFHPSLLHTPSFFISIIPCPLLRSRASKLSFFHHFFTIFNITCHAHPPDLINPNATTPDHEQLALLSPSSAPVPPAHARYFGPPNSPCSLPPT